MRNAAQPQPGMPEDFDAVARRYWSAWSDALRAATPGSTRIPDASPWQQQIDWWTTIAKGGDQPASDDALDRFNAQARQWFGTMQQVAGQFAGRDAGPADIASAWRQAMAAMAAMGGAGAANPIGAASMGAFGAAPMGVFGAAPFMQGFSAMPGMGGMGGMPRFGAMPGMPGWGAIPGFGTMPGALPGMDGNPFAALMQGMQQAPGTHGFDHWFAQVAPWLKTLQGGATAMPPMPDMAAFFQAPAMPQTPTFGHNRERDARWQSLARAIGELQQRMQAYATLMQRATQDAFVVFEGKLAEHEEPGRQLSSGRALFDVWIDSAEEAYARIALTAEFRTVYGALVDAQMRVRGGVQVEVEHACAQLGMPTRTELDGAHRKIVELERQMRRLRDAASPRASKTPAADARTAEPRRAVRPVRAATVREAEPDAVDAPPASPPRVDVAAKAVATKVSTKKKKTTAKKSGKERVATKKAATMDVASRKVATNKAAKRNAATKKTPAAKRVAAKKSAASAAPPAEKSVKTQRAATRNTPPRGRSASRRQPSSSNTRRASPAPTRSAAKRAPRPPSRRGAMSVFVDTPMPVAPASLKGKL